MRIKGKIWFFWWCFNKAESIISAYPVRRRRWDVKRSVQPAAWGRRRAVGLAAQVPVLDVISYFEATYRTADFCLFERPAVCRFCHAKPNRLTTKVTRME